MRTENSRRMHALPFQATNLSSKLRRTPVNSCERFAYQVDAAGNPDGPAHNHLLRSDTTDKR